jgi:radical SAM superfamily enzyme YgiQ (UPF0313 family)
LLICPPQKTVYGRPAFPRLGLAYLSGALFEQGIDHDIIDLSLYLDDWPKVLEARLNNHTTFGITSTTFEFKAARQVANHINNHVPDALIILGGPHATLTGQKILTDQPEFDYILKGEGERVLPEFVRSVENDAQNDIERLPGVYQRNSRGINGGRISWIKNLNRISQPRYEKFELEKYAEAPKAMQVLTSRGCSFGCIYCSVGIVMGRKFRFRDPDNIISEIEDLITTYGSSSFSFNDDNLTFDIDRAKALCRLIIDKGLNIRWNASNGIRVDYLDEELVVLMKDSGCEEVAIGIESTNNEILRNLKKGTNLKKIEQAIALFRKYEIPLKGFFLVGSPGETRQDVFNSLAFAKKHLKNARFSMLTPYPGTALWQWVSENNYWTEEKPIEEIINYTHIGEGKTCYETPSFSKNEKESTYQEIYRQWDQFSHSLSFTGRLKYRINAHPRIYKLVKWSYQNLKKAVAHR